MTQEDTRVLDLPADLGADTAAMAMARPEPVSTRRTVSTKAVALAAVAALAVVLLGVLLVANRGDAPAQSRQVEEPTLPAGVPEELRDPLLDLHRAVEGGAR